MATASSQLRPFSSAAVTLALRSLFVLLLLIVPAAASPQDNSALVQAWALSHGEERILNYTSAVTIERDGDLDVTETIRVVALNQQINHGIYRDFPTSYSTNLGHDIHVGFEVLSVQRDGKDEPWARETVSNGVRVRIGSADVTLAPAAYTYVIRYRTTRQIYYGADYDELYWNVTGNGWMFPIDHAEARITLPKQVEARELEAWTGPQGSTAHDAEVVTTQPGTIVFRTTKELGSYEGMTISAKLPKGVLEEPSGARKLGWWIADWGATCAALLAILGLGLYYFRAWAKAGRGPRAGTIVPNFSPPDDLSPAAMRYIEKMRFDNRAFSAAMVFLAVKGQLHIAKEETGLFGLGSTTTLTRTDIGRAGDTSALPQPESAMRNALFLTGETLELKQENHSTLQSAQSALSKGLDQAYEGRMFVKNTDWALYGLGLILLAILGVAVIGVFSTPGIPLEQKFGPPLLCVGLLLVLWWVRQATADSKGCAKFVALGVFSIGALAAAFGTIATALSAGVFAVLLPLVVLLIGIPAFWWMYAPTVEGRAVMDRIAGFKQYLSITEEQRLDAMHPPEKTPELFERYLPYAIALEVENRWADKFAAVLAAAAAAGTTAHTMAWYSGSGNVWDDPQGFAGDMGSSLASTVSSASASPSSSGSGGGGSSGGGGGGGGGGGW